MLLFYHREIMMHEWKIKDSKTNHLLAAHHLITFHIHLLLTRDKLYTFAFWLHRFLFFFFLRFKEVWNVSEFALFGVLFSPCLCAMIRALIHWIYMKSTRMQALTFVKCCLTYCFNLYHTIATDMNYKKCMHKYTYDWLVQCTYVHVFFV